MYREEASQRRRREMFVAAVPKETRVDFELMCLKETTSRSLQSQLKASDDVLAATTTKALLFKCSYDDLYPCDKC